MTSLYWSQPLSGVLCTQNSDFMTRITSLYGSQTSPVDLCMQNSELSTKQGVCMGPSLHLPFLYTKSDFMTRKTSLYGSLISPVDLCMHNNVRSTRITSLYGSQHSSGLFACKTACLEPELQISMCRSPDLWFCAFKTATLGPKLQVSMGPRSHLWFLC